MTAAPSVLSVIAASQLEIEEQAFIAACGEGEVPMNESGGASPFTILYSGGRLREPNPNIKVINGNRYWDGSLASFPDWAGATTGQLVSTAAGLCQDTRTTFREEAAGFGITDFTPPSQVEFNIKLARKVFKAISGTELIAALKAGPSGLALIPTHLKSTWPGGCDSRFPKRYTANLAALQLVS
jgi:muramidase (phage lysozyme)